MFISLYVILQHSAQYIKTDSMQFLYSSILVRLLMLIDFKKRLSLTKNPLALPILATISLSVSTSDVTTLPNYVHCDVLLILVSVFSSLGVYLIIQSTATMNNFLSLFINAVLILCTIILQKILLGTDSKVIPLQLLQSVIFLSFPVI